VRGALEVADGVRHHTDIVTPCFGSAACVQRLLVGCLLAIVLVS
jgi:hypothetical protein